MREYLFRGKPKHYTNHDKVKVEWVYGNLQLLENKTVVWVADRAVIPETAGQFTGLTDKNGVKIFEGDIVEYDGLNHLVDWHPNDAIFVATIPRIQELGFVAYMSEADQFTILGNIHDNPELLEEA